MTDYCTVADLKARTGMTGTDTARDTILAAEVTAASRAIDRWCNRPPNGFVAQTQTRYYDVPATAYGVLRAVPNPQMYTLNPTAGVYLPRNSGAVIDLDPLLSVTSVKTDPEGDGTYSTTWAATDYDLLPLNAAADGQPYRALRPSQASAQYLPVGPRVLQIVGSWGEAATCPELINRVALLVAHRNYKRNTSPYGVINDLVTAEGGAVSVPRLDPDVKALLMDAGYIDQWFFA